MALIKCPECGHQVSDKASACPSCGCPLSVTSAPQTSTPVQNKPQTAAIQKEPTWVEDLKKKAKRGTLIKTILVSVFFVLAICFSLLVNFDKKVSSTYSGRTYYETKVIWQILTTYCWMFAFVFLVIFLMNFANRKIVLEYHDDKVIAVYRRFRKPTLFVNGEKTPCEFSKISYNTIEYKYKIGQGELLILTIQGRKISFDYYYSSPRNVQNQTIVNNYITNNTINKKNKNSERSDMEKILIKNAKIDALASIDPTNTEKTKEQLDIINKLDDLD